MLPSEPWLAWPTIGFIAAYALAIGLAVLLRRRARRALGRRAPGAAAPPDDDAVACPACGVENDTDFRFCRSCVEELPGGSPSPLTSATPVGR